MQSYKYLKPRTLINKILNSHIQNHNQYSFPQILIMVPKFIFIFIQSNLKTWFFKIVRSSADNDDTNDQTMLVY